MSLPNAVHPCSVCDQVRPTDAQYRDYKRSGESFWSKLETVKLDTAKLEHLFESKSKEMPVTKVNSLNQNNVQRGLGHQFYGRNVWYWLNDLTNQIIPAASTEKCC